MIKNKNKEEKGAGAGGVKRPEWPSVEEQLAAAKVTEGSELENLIRDNQDFHILRPEESKDQLGLPPWLRVYWRKLHPNANYSGPSGGYPLLLGELNDWMLDNQDLRTPPANVVDPADPRPPVPYTGGSNKKGGRHGH